MRWTVNTPVFDFASFVMTRLVRADHRLGRAAAAAAAGSVPADPAAAADPARRPRFRPSKVRTTVELWVECASSCPPGSPAYITAHFSGNVRGNRAGGRANMPRRPALFRATRRYSVANDDRSKDEGITRRDFNTRLGAAAAGVVAGSELLGPFAYAGPHVNGRVLGANDRVVMAQIGIHSQGNSLKRGFAQLKNVEIKTLCDVDEQPVRLARQRQGGARQGAGVQAWLPAGHAPRLRRQGHRRRRHRDPEPLARAGLDLGRAGRQARLHREAGVAHGVGRPADDQRRARATTRSCRSAR